VRARFHRFLLALLMLVLPLQGLAFASMLDVPIPAQPAVAGQLAQADGMMDACHAHEPAQPDAPPAQHPCKHCAACVLGSALPTPVGAGLAALPALHGFASYPDTPYPGFVPDGPERPPRPFLA
jgi:hypothetical protein